MHLQENPRWDRFRLFLKSRSNGETNFWHTKSYQQAVKMLKEAYLKSGQEVSQSREQEAALIDYKRGNAMLHFKKTSTRREMTSLTMGRQGTQNLLIHFTAKALIMGAPIFYLSF